MTAQAFFYNAIFFTYALVLTDFYAVPAGRGRLVHPAVRGRQFPRAAAARAAVRRARAPADDRVHLHHVGRAAGRSAATLFAQGTARARPQQTFAWTVIFFFASAAASSAYLTVSETFPLEIRALAIAFFYAVGTGDRRHRRAVAVRRADRHRLAGELVRRLPAWRRADDRGRTDRRALRGGGRAQAARAGGAAARLRGLGHAVANRDRRRQRSPRHRRRNRRGRRWP